ncbi:MAG TPA: tRNA uridine(34) 5-carboxymethylaminomethyl modification radical SAM/GNAT enzyme Elp3 [Chloroflexota bacterium]|nr:tRNA uridine(34) 5-carboxymethylaminomethyl modification radical SAM/GNAT enzyme Elp3 [Chloroflexota bacterium]
MRKYEANTIVPPAEVRQLAAEWLAQHEPVRLESEQEPLFIQFVQALARARVDTAVTGPTYQRLMRTYAARGLPWLGKSDVLYLYAQLCADGRIPYDPDFVTHLQKKPTRSQAGVTVVTVLTKPYPCPGECIFCPTDVRMPKSYLHDEPGAQRAERHGFDPYAQTAARIQALEQIGHPAEKIELLILGGTWSSYRRDYQEWFVQRCLDAMNGEESASLAEAQEKNAVGPRRNVGLVVETRQDFISPDELRWFRTLGVTKVQVGIQSLDEHVLAINKRGHDVQSTRDAFRLLRLAGFKIHGHWMANLLGATPESDRADFARLWTDTAVRPDELKIYPCMLVQNADLYGYWQRGEYEPYDEETLTDLLADCLAQVPRYVRVNRVIRDFPTTNVVAGNKKANLRQVATERVEADGRSLQDIRAREIRRQKVRRDELQLRVTTYETDATTEHFLSFETADERLAGFLRLSFPHPEQELPIPELAGHAMIREVHVYGPALNLGDDSEGEAQHMGLGSELISKAKEMARAAGFPKIAVISAIGTRAYYGRYHNFVMDGLYMTAVL